MATSRAPLRRRPRKRRRQRMQSPRNLAVAPPAAAPATDAAGEEPAAVDHLADLQSSGASPSLAL